MGAPALGKNSLAVGATSNGPSGGTTTGVDGRLIYDRLGYVPYSVEGYPWICVDPGNGAPSSSTEQSDIDTIAFFSSYGPTADGRIKPDVVAPGDQVRHRFPVCDGSSKLPWQHVACAGPSEQVKMGQ